MHVLTVHTLRPKNTPTTFSFHALGIQKHACLYMRSSSRGCLGTTTRNQSPALRMVYIYRRLYCLKLRKAEQMLRPTIGYIMQTCIFEMGFGVNQQHIVTLIASESTYVFCTSIMQRSIVPISSFISLVEIGRGKLQKVLLST